jgi:hypothetical protein
MTRPIQLKGFKLSKAGKVERDQRRLDVSTRIKKQASRKVRVTRRTPR